MLCGLLIEEDIAHCFMQCPFLHDTKAQMLMDIKSLGDRSGRFFLETYQNIFPVLIGASELWLKYGRYQAPTSSVCMRPDYKPGKVLGKSVFLIDVSPL